MNSMLGTRNFALRTAFMSVALLATLGACTTERQLRGYIEDKELTEAVQPGLDNRNSVRGMLGNPSVAGTFDSDIWYYVSSRNSRRAFFHEKPRELSILAVYFGERGVVSEVKRYSLADVKKIDPVNDKTPTRGKQLGFFEQIFGNIGRFAGPQGQGGGQGGRPPR